jgi:hypothetical protein
VRSVLRRYAHYKVIFPPTQKKISEQRVGSRASKAGRSL